MTNPLLSLSTIVAQRAKNRLIQKTRETIAVQQDFLLGLLRYQQQTELGQKYCLNQIKTVDAFRAEVPILPYSSYASEFERTAQGERNLITPDRLTFVNMTSGSTGKQKLIPVTRCSRRAVERANQAAMGFAIDVAHQRGLAIGKLLMTTSARAQGRTSGGIEYGPVSGGTLRLSNIFYRQVFAQPFEALLPADMTARNYVCLLFALRNANLSIIAATFPILALQLCEYLEKFAEELIWDLQHGTISKGIKLEPELRGSLERQWSSATDRAVQLHDIWRAEKRLTPQLSWSNLSFIITARGGTSDFYFQRFPEYFGDVPVFGGTYASAEATFGVHRDFNTDGTILAIESAFFEFVPADQWEVAQPKTLLAHEVEVGAFYRILITNYAGLYRYDIGDVIEVVGFYNQAPLIVFRYRVGGTLSATTEKTTEHHAIQVVQSLQQKFGILLEDFCITLSERLVAAYYVLNVELAPGQHLDDPRAFLAAFDRQIQQANVSFAAKRVTGEVGLPRLRLLAPGSFAILRYRQVRPGVFNSQLKTPHISGDRQFLSGLTVEQEIRLPEDEGELP
jgi:hypothetical protein